MIFTIRRDLVEINFQNENELIGTMVKIKQNGKFYKTKDIRRKDGFIIGFQGKDVMIQFKSRTIRPRLINSAVSK